MKKSIIISLCLMLSASMASAQTVFMENKPWEEVKAAAIKAKKPIFMDCYTTWCGPCKRLATVIFPQKEVGDYLNATFVCCKYDMEKGDGAMLHEKYKNDIPGFPTMLMLDPATGEIIHKVVGAQEADKLIAGIKEGMNGETVPAYKKRYDAGERSISFIEKYGHVLDVAYDKETKEKITKEFVESLPIDSMLNKDVMTMYLPYMKDVHSSRYKFVLDNISKYQYVLQMNRYTIESRLRSTMDDAVKDVVKLYIDNSANADSVAKVKREEDFLKKLLKNDIKGFGRLNAKFAILDVCMTGDMSALDKALDYDKMFGATSDVYFFRPQMYNEIINKADAKKQKNLIAKYVQEIQASQDKADARSKGDISMFTQNDNDVLAVGYFRLGDKKKSHEYGKKYIEVYQIQKQKLKEAFGDNASYAIDETFDKRVSALKEKIQMKD